MHMHNTDNSDKKCVKCGDLFDDEEDMCNECIYDEFEKLSGPAFK